MKRVILGALLLAGVASAADEVKTLDAVTIEGEVRLPQVLFITSRDSERPLDFLSLYAPATSLELGQTTLLPNQIQVLSDPTSAAPAPVETTAGAEPLDPTTQTTDAVDDPSKEVHP